jgi:tRNA nucleotidyltransferase (CCA-adding enzyme)
VERSTVRSEFEEARDRLRRTPWPSLLLRVLERLREGGHQAWLVGGAVRDALLSRPTVEEWDLATDLRPEVVTSRFGRVEPIGLRHGTVLLLEGGLRFECTTFRSELHYSDARHPDAVAFGDDPRADLSRRDLTINALAFDPISGVLLDPFDGCADLRRGILRAVGDPAARFEEDALRPLRMARFAAVLEMEPEPATRKALAIPSERAALVAWERVREECMKMMRAERPSRGFWLLHEAGLLALWLPELDAGFAVPQNRHHAYDVFVHSLECCDAAPADKPRVRWAALLHDIGKPVTAVMRRGDWTFYGHAEAGAELADGALRRLRFSNEDREAIVRLVREHMFDYRAEWSDAAIRRWLRRVGVDAVADLFDLRIADALGNGRRQGWPAGLAPLRERIERVLESEQALNVRDLALSGSDVMRVLGFPPGPEVGRTLDAMLDAVIEQPSLNTRENLERWLSRSASAKTKREA